MLAVTKEVRLCIIRACGTHELEKTLGLELTPEEKTLAGYGRDEDGFRFEWGEGVHAFMSERCILQDFVKAYLMDRSCSLPECILGGTRDVKKAYDFYDPYTFHFYNSKDVDSPDIEAKKDRAPVTIKIHGVKLRGKLIARPKVTPVEYLGNSFMEYAFLVELLQDGEPLNFLHLKKKAKRLGLSINALKRLIALAYEGSFRRYGWELGNDLCMKEATP